MRSIAQEAFRRAQQEHRDEWVPACGGTERAFTSRSGINLLYCWNPGQNRHAYLNLDTDIILTDEEARTVLGIE